MEEAGIVERELATWSSSSTCSFNGEVLSVEGSLGHDGNFMYENIHLVIERGVIYGLVGINGSGKTSLVRALPTLPNFPSSSSFTVEYLAHETYEKSMQSTREYCLSRIHRRRKNIQKEIQTLEDELDQTDANESNNIEKISNQLGQLYELDDQLTSEGEEKVDIMLNELSFGQFINMPFHQLSSGWRYKCELISCLITQPDLFIIDEPSFLDIQSTDWLIGKLQELCHTQHVMLILISHKESLMDELCDRILFLNPRSKTLTSYNCSYSEFRIAHGDKLVHAQRAKQTITKDHNTAKSSLEHIKKQLNKREKNFKSITSEYAIDKRFVKGKNKEAKQKADKSAASKLKKIQKKVAEIQEQEEALRENKVVPLYLEGKPLDNNQPLLTMEDVAFRYNNNNVEECSNIIATDDEFLFQYVSCQIISSDRILLRGRNGYGKSTLVDIIMGKLVPTIGDIRRHLGKVIHFPQDAIPDLVYKYGDISSTDLCILIDPNITITDVRTFLGKFGITGVIATKPIKVLSAGQRTRLWISIEYFKIRPELPSLLILDELTENLDQDTVDTLLDALEVFQAAVVTISHSDYFCNHFSTTQIWTISQRRLFVEFTS